MSGCETRGLVIMSVDSGRKRWTAGGQKVDRWEEKEEERQSVMHILTCFLLVVVVAVTVINFVAKIVRLWFLSGAKRRGSGDA